MTAPVEQRRSVWGSQYALLAAANGTTTQWPGPGNLASVIVQTTGTATRSFYDGTGATPVFTVAANAGQGTIYQCAVPIINAIVSDGITGSPGVTVVFNGWQKYTGGE